MTEDEDVTDEPSFTVSISTAAPPKQVLLVPDKTPVPFEYRDGCTTFTARALHIYDLYLLQLQEE